MKTRNKEKRIYIYKIIVTIIFALLVMFVLHIAQNYIRNEISDKTNLVINNNNVTKSLKNDVIIENESSCACDLTSSKANNIWVDGEKITSEEGSKDTIYKTGQSNSRSLKVATIKGKIILNNK